MVELVVCLYTFILLLKKKVIFEMGTISKKVNGELLFGNSKVG
jgi:hypothetical protein